MKTQGNMYFLDNDYKNLSPSAKYNHLNVDLLVVTETWLNIH